MLLMVPGILHLKLIFLKKNQIKLKKTVFIAIMPVRTRNGQHYKQWMFDQKIGSSDVLDPNYECGLDDHSGFDPTLTGLAMRAFEKVNCTCMACGRRHRLRLQAHPLYRWRMC